MECLELHQPHLVRDQKVKLGLECHFVGAERTANLSMNVGVPVDDDAGTRSNLYVPSESYLMEGNKIGMNGAQNENGLFSSFLSEVLNKKCKFPFFKLMLSHLPYLFTGAYSVSLLMPHLFFPPI